MQKVLEAKRAIMAGLFIAILFAFLIYLQYSFSNDLYCPGIIFTLYWGLNIFIPYLLWQGEITGYLFASFFVFLSCCVVQLGVSFTRRRHKSRNEIIGHDRGRFPLFQTKLLQRAMILLNLIVLIVPSVFLSSSSGFDPTALMSVDEFSEMSAANRSFYGYGGGGIHSIGMPILLSFIYGSAACGGTLIALSPLLTNRILGILPLFFCFIMGVSYGSRMGVLFGGGLFLSTFLATKLYVLRENLNRSKILIQAVGISLLMIFSLSIITMLFRYREMAEFKLDKILERSLEQFCFFPAFSYWFSSEGGWNNTDFSLGYRSFTRPFEWLGIQLDIQHSVNVVETSSNIFTLFRGLIEDFTVGGSMIFLFLFGLFAGNCYQRVSRGDVYQVMGLSTVYFIIIVSIAFSPFVYTTQIFALFLYYFVFLITKPLRSKP